MKKPYTILALVVIGGIAYGTRSSWWPKPPPPKVEYHFNAAAETSFYNFIEQQIPQLKEALLRAGYELCDPRADNRGKINIDGPLGAFVDHDTIEGIASGQASAHFCLEAKSIQPSEFEKATGLGQFLYPEFFLHNGRWYLLLKNGYVENFASVGDGDSFKHKIPPELHVAIKSAFPDHMTMDEWARAYRSFPNPNP
jgi:hypothetical protein